MNYGPYDNGHIIIGFSSGHLLILNSLDLSCMFRMSIFESSQRINKIIFEPTNQIIVSSDQCGKEEGLVAISLIEGKAQYQYLEIGQGSYMTVVIPK